MAIESQFNAAGHHGRRLTVEEQAVTTNGDTGSASWTIDVTVPCAGGCTLTPGYWKTHSSFGVLSSAGCQLFRKAPAAATTIRLVPKDESGISAQAPYRYFVGVVLDEPPELELRLKGIGTAVTPNAKLPIEAVATDEPTRRATSARRSSRRGTSAWW